MTNIETALQKTVGFGIREFVEKAIEGGCDSSWTVCGNCLGTYGKDHIQIREGNRYCANKPHDIGAVFLDPIAWQAVGKVEGWERAPLSDIGHHIVNTHGFGEHEPHIWKMHNFLDALIEQV